MNKKNLQYVKRASSEQYGMIVEHSGHTRFKVPTCKVAWLYAGGISYVENISDSDIEVVPQPQGLFRNDTYIYIIYKVHSLATGKFAFPVAWAMLEDEAYSKMIEICRMYPQTELPSLITIKWRTMEDLLYVINLDASDIERSQFFGFEFSPSPMTIFVQSIINELDMAAYCKVLNDTHIQLRIRTSVWNIPATTVLSALCDYGVDVISGDMDTIFDTSENGLYIYRIALCTRKFIHSLNKYSSVLDTYGKLQKIDVRGDDF
tara:strand:- start:3292 stop:4077 length:786 start_codon:yes stop_codon:yes gene_type:complete